MPWSFLNTVLIARVVTRMLLTSFVFKLACSRFSFWSGLTSNKKWTSHIFNMMGTLIMSQELITILVPEGESHRRKWQENTSTKSHFTHDILFSCSVFLARLMRKCMLFKSRYKEAESDYNKYLDLIPGTASVEKELSQLLQAQNSLQSAYGQFDSGDFSKVLEYINKIVLVFSPGCLKV